MNYRNIISSAVLIALIGSSFFQQDTKAATLVGSPFMTSYNNWIDTYTGGQQDNPPPNWGIHLLDNPLMMENSGGAQGRGTSNNTGDFTPYIMLQDGVVTGTDYSLEARMYTSDDDGFGLIFGYVDADNYYRVSMRQQTSGSLGFTRGLSVQKVVGGVVTQISPVGTGEGDLSVPTQSMIDNRTPIDIAVDVTGTSWSVSVAGINGGNAIISGTDAGLTGGKTGIQSWFQRIDSGTTSPVLGTEVDDFTVRDGTGAQLFQDTFEAGSPVKWRELVMVDGAGNPNPLTAQESGNFSLRFNGTIQDDSNGFLYGTTDAPPNTDFIGPAIVVDEPGSAAYSDYELKVRMNNEDNDGSGVLVRVQDDDTFYRVTFETQGLEGDPNTYRRPTAGMSVQKVINGVWSQLYEDDQNAIPFTPSDGVDFDVKVIAVGDKLKIQVIDDPDGAAVVHDYPLIVDNSSPLLTGTVGFHNWGSGGNANTGIVWSDFGGTTGAPFLIEQSEIPEPSTLVLLLLGAVSLLRVRSRN